MGNPAGRFISVGHTYRQQEPRRIKHREILQYPKCSSAGLVVFMNVSARLLAESAYSPHTRGDGSRIVAAKVLLCVRNVLGRYRGGFVNEVPSRRRSKPADFGYFANIGR